MKIRVTDIKKYKRIKVISLILLGLNILILFFIFKYRGIICRILDCSSLSKISLLFSVFNLILFLSLRPGWTAVSGFFGHKNNDFAWKSYILVSSILFAVLIINIATSIFYIYRMALHIVLIIIGVLFMEAGVSLIFGKIIDTRFKWYTVLYFIQYLALSVLISQSYRLAYNIKPMHDISSMVLGFVVSILLIVFCICLTYRYSINFFLGSPVVYAVEDEYQIVFVTTAKSMGWVTINGDEYYDLYGGSMNADRIHKVCIRQEILDKSKKYTINSKNLVYKGPMGGITGKTIRRDYSFRPVDTTNELKYFNIADIHMNKKAAVRTNSYAKEYDFLVIAGDSTWMVDSFFDAYCGHAIAGALSKGLIPVVYARGNHDIKGRYANNLYKFVGSKNQEFYYWVTMSNVYILVLDLGEAQEDDWWEFYGTAKFGEYRQKQVEFLKKELARCEYQKHEYRLCVCHIPIVFVNDRHDFATVKQDLTGLINKFGIDMSVCAHEHEILIFEPGTVKSKTKLVYNGKFKSGSYGGYLTDFEFPSLMVGKTGYLQNDKKINDSLIGLCISVDIEHATQICTYLNSKGEKLSLVNPFADIDYGTSITLTKK